MRVNGRFDPVPLWYVAECMTCGERFDSENSAKHHAEIHENTHAITMDPGEGRRVELREKNIHRFIESKFHDSFNSAMDSFMKDLEMEYAEGSLDENEVYGALESVLGDKSISEEARSRWLRFTMEHDDEKEKEDES